MTEFKTYITMSGDVLLYCGSPKLELLDELATGPGDVWHSSLDHGFKNCFPELVYQTAVYWWFLNDFEGVSQAVNWRVDANHFVVRASVWKTLKGFDADYEGVAVKGLDFGFTLLRYAAGIPMYIKGLFEYDSVAVKVSTQDRYRFFAKHFKLRHSYYMLWRQGLFKFPKEFAAFKKAKTINRYKAPTISLRALKPIQGNPTVSLVIPTMKRQYYTELLLQDYNQQTYPIKEAVIVDATPEAERDVRYYQSRNFNFDITLKWQTTKGSCRARNEAIALCTGDYIIFADDDVRVLPDFVENHIKLLQTYGAKACNGLDIMAQHVAQDLNDLKKRLNALSEARWKVGVSPMFSNANGVVKRELVAQLQGNDVNFDGGYGEDSDFGLRILKMGEVLLFNPFSPNLHLKPPQGGYRFWGTQAGVLGKNRKTQPWELDTPVKWIRPIPSPTISYGVLKHFSMNQVKEWRKKHFFIYFFKGSKKQLLLRFFRLPYKQFQFSKSLAYAKRLINLGERYS
ncbi:glycosyltransferase family 2 protein [Formosa sp. S-31]|uniref:glycosyltransferase family 2 protein n=1 Tax=Formosa sp. S-31 TaxID=2790949 RepID=UPI003EBCFE14